MADDTTRPNRPQPHHHRPDRAGGAGQHLDLDALGAWLDGGLDDDDRRAAAAHLADCLLCRGELAELRATVALLRGLPQYAPRRSFRLGPEHAGPAARAEGRLLRLLPALPALRAATVAVAVLLAAVVTGDLVSTVRDDASDRRVVTFGDGGVVEEAPPAAADPAPPGQLPAEAFSEDEALAQDAEPAPGTDAAGGTEPAAAASNRVGAPDGAAPAIAPGGGRQATGTDLAAEDGVEDDAPFVDADADGAADAANADGEADADAAASGDGGGPSAWRLAEIGLGLLLAVLLVAVVALRRLGRAPPDPVAPV